MAFLFERIVGSNALLLCMSLFTPHNMSGLVGSRVSYVHICWSVLPTGLSVRADGAGGCYHGSEIVRLTKRCSEPALCVEFMSHWFYNIGSFDGHPLLALVAELGR